MPKFSVVAGLRLPQDPESKSRPAIVLMQSEDKVLVMPCTTWSARHGLAVPPGCAILRTNSPAFNGTGLSEETTLRVKDTAAFRRDSEWVKCLRRIGTLDLLKDKRLAAQLGELIRANNLDTLLD